MTIRNKAERIIEYGLKYPEDKIALFGKRFRSTREIFLEIERLLIKGSIKFESKCRGDRWEIIKPFRLIMLPIDCEAGLRGFRFQAIFVDDLKELTQKQVKETLLPYLEITFNPVIEIPENPRDPILIDLSKPLDKIEFSPLDHE